MTPPKVGKGGKHKGPFPKEERHAHQQSRSEAEVGRFQYCRKKCRQINPATLEVHVKLSHQEAKTASEVKSSF